MSGKSEFHTALARLKPFLNRDNEIAQLFQDVCARHNREINWNDSRHIKDIEIPFYLSDAINIMERRKDGYGGKSALLFNEKSKHILEFRRIVNRVQSTFSPETKEYQAATKISDALESAITAARPFQNTQKQEGENGFQVIGCYSGIIAREFGSWVPQKLNKHDVFAGNTLIEIKIEDMRHLIERNGLTAHDGTISDTPNGLDFRIIFRDGSAHTFNWKKPDSYYFDYDIDERFIAAAGKASPIHGKIPLTIIEEVEKNLAQLVLELEKSHPPLIAGGETNKNVPDMGAGKRS